DRAVAGRHGCGGSTGVMALGGAARQRQSGGGTGTERGGERGRVGPVAYLAAVACDGARGHRVARAMAGAGGAGSEFLAGPGCGAAVAVAVRLDRGAGLAGSVAGGAALAAGNRHG